MEVDVSGAVGEVDEVCCDSGASVGYASSVGGLACSVGYSGVVCAV